MKKAKSNFQPDWRLEPPPEGDIRYLGHPSHDARGFLKKHSQFDPWVLHCMCGKIHKLPQQPELSMGLPVMIFAIDSVNNPIHAIELNGQAGKICGPPDRDGCYPIKVSRSGEVALLPPSMLKTQVLTAMGPVYDGRKAFKSRAVEDEDGNVFLPPLAPSKVSAAKQKKPSLGMFLRNFSKFIQDGIKVERYGSHGPTTVEFPQTGVTRPPALLWMDTALTSLFVGADKLDPYRSKFDVRLLSKIVCWNDGDTAPDHGRGNDDGWSTEGGTIPSLSFDGDSLESSDSLNSAESSSGRSASCRDGGRRGGGGGAAGGGGGAGGGRAANNSRRRRGPSRLWREPNGKPGNGSMRRDLTLAVSDLAQPEAVDEANWAQKLDPAKTPFTFVHLRCSSTKVRLYVATCLAAMTSQHVTEEEAPAFRGSTAVAFEPPPLGKPKDQQKALIGMKPMVHSPSPKLNWSPYVALRRFNHLQFDSEGFVSRVCLPECGVEMDLLDLGCVLGQRLLELDLYFNEGFTGDLAMTTNCPNLERLNLGNCVEVSGNVSCFDQCYKSLNWLDLHWCKGVHGEIESFRKCVNLVHLNLSGNDQLTGRLETLRHLAKLEVLQLTGTLFQGDIQKAFGNSRMPNLRVLSLEGCKDVVGDIGVVAHLPLLEELRLSGCSRVHGDVRCFTVGPPVQDADGYYDDGNKHFDRGYASALHYFGSGGVERDAVTVGKSLVPVSLKGVMALNDDEEEVGGYGVFDNRHHGRGPDPRPLSRLTEVGLHDCRGVTGDAAVFASLPLLGKLVLWRTEVQLGEAYGCSKAALKKILPPGCLLLM